MIEAPATFGGRWIPKDEPGYDDARRMFNQRADPHPSVIAVCQSTSDVSAAIATARAHRLTIDVRSSGSTFRLPVEEGLLIDLSRMRGVQVRPHERVARIQGGTRGGDLQTEASRFGLAGVTGALSSTGVGLMLAGGVGHLSPRVGFASDNVLALEVVTASGEIVTASPTENRDLFWALRGSTGNFGVVTSLEVRLHPVPELVSAGLMTWSVGNIGRAIDGLRSLWNWASDDFSIIAVVSSESMNGAGGIDMFVCHSGEPSEARRELDRFRTETRPDVDDINEVTFRDIHFGFDESFPPRRGSINEVAVTALSDDMVDSLVSATMEDAEGASRFVEIVLRRGALGRAPEHPSALRETAEEPTWSLGPGCWWDDPTADQAQDRWLASVIDSIRRIGPTVDRAHPNSVGVGLSAGGVAAMYGDRFDRLAELKRVWDPENVFRGSHNIPPAD